MKEDSQERFLDVSEILRDVPGDLIFEDEEEGDFWDHEARFTRNPDGMPFSLVQSSKSESF